MNAAPFLSRHLGDYLLVAQLSEDALGTVFRALYAADERRFVRLRILRSEDLSPEAVLWAIRENGLRGGSLVHEAIVDRPQLDVVEGIPFMTWDESGGWTLDTLLSRVHAFGIRTPHEYALLIAERIAAALEHAHETMLGDRPADHGLLWPGFVSISHDAAVRVGGFGIAEGVLPSLGGLRMTTEIAPFVAPEIRGGGPIWPNSDVYSLGAILVELVTGRQPSLETPSAELRAGDPRSEELGTFLRRCLAAPDERFASAADAHRALQRMLTGSPFSLYTANLSLFLYKLLNPESQSVAPSSDWEATNPVVIQASAQRTATEPAAQTAPPEVPRRRSGDIDPRELPAAEPAVLSTVPAPEPLDHAPAPAPVQERAAHLIQGPRPRRWRGLVPDARRRPGAALAAAAGLAIGVIFVLRPLSERRPAPAQNSTAAEVFVPAAAPVSPEPSPTVEATNTWEMPLAPTPPAGGYPTAAHRSAPRPGPGRKVQPELRRPAEDLRLRAALARIEADRIHASEKAATLFGEGRQSEQEGERLLHQRDYDAAQLAFSRAARLFEQAQQITWEGLVRVANHSESP